MNAPFASSNGRFVCLTEKVATPMGPVFVHVDVDALGRAVSMRIDQAQKFENTAVGELLDCVGEALNRLIATGGTP